MDSANTEIKSSYNLSLSSVFEWMPVCALIIDSNGIIQEVNQKAIQFFRATTKEDFIFDKQNLSNMIIDSHRANELVKLICKSPEPVNKEILIRRFDKSITGVDLHACLFPDNPNRILIQFYEKKSNNHIYIHELSQAFRREAQRLRPYLNKPGKNILEEIIVNDIIEDTVSNKSAKKSQVVNVSDDRLKKLSEIFPKFSNNDLIICGYLSLKISIDEIASLTGKTPNCLRVSFHRILRKTTFPSGKEFLRKLENI
jgi:nitrogen-specific signal transduction histidine kinase